MRVLDLGTGSGAIALAIAHERPRATIVATDVSADALDVARDNARRLGLANVEFVRADWYDGLAPTAAGGAFDVIVSNPPYVDAADPHLREGDVRFEPARALTPGGNGTAAIVRIVAGARERLVPGGSLAVEHGYDQADAVRAVFAVAGFAEIVDDARPRRHSAGRCRAAGRDSIGRAPGDGASHPAQRTQPYVSAATCG